MRISYDAYRESWLLDGCLSGQRKESDSVEVGLSEANPLELSAISVYLDLILPGIFRFFAGEAKSCCPVAVLS